MKQIFHILFFLFFTLSCNAQKYTMPSEDAPHTATWLQWPHQYQYGEEFRNRLDATWVAMATALSTSEEVNIIVYNTDEKERIETLLKEASVTMEALHFFEMKTDDFWIRDNGPIYVKNEKGDLLIQDWGFNGWGNKAKYSNCNLIPTLIGEAQNIKVIDLNDVIVNEGGAVEFDGHGTMISTRSAVTNSNRNPNLSEKEVEEQFEKNLGITHFIWLDGKAGLEITDMHIDGFARFAEPNILVTMSHDDLEEWSVPELDIKKLHTAKNKIGEKYKQVLLPLTKKNVKTTYEKQLDFKGSYINYYIANTVVLVPNYNDANDKIANAIIQKLYPTRKVIGIDVCNLYANGGMIHCVTQQQPK